MNWHWYYIISSLSWEYVCYKSKFHSLWLACAFLPFHLLLWDDSRNTFARWGFLDLRLPTLYNCEEDIYFPYKLPNTMYSVVVTQNGLRQKLYNLTLTGGPTETISNKVYSSSTQCKMGHMTQEVNSSHVFTWSKAIWLILKTLEI